MSKLAKNTILYTIGTLLPQAAAFILLPIYTRFLTPSDYGVLSSIQVVNSVLVIFYTLAIDKAIYRLYFDFKTDKEKKDFLGTIFIGITTSVIVITSLLFMFPGILGNIYKNITFYPYMSLGVIASSLATFAIIPRSVYFVQEKANRYILISLSEFFLRNAFIVVFVVFLSKGVAGYLQGRLIGSAVLVPIFLFLTFRQINFTFNLTALKESLKFSVPILPMIVSAWVMSAIDRVFIERYFDTHDVGIYSLGYRIAMLVTVVSGSFYKAYNPYYFKTATTESKIIALPKLKKTNTIFVLSVIVSSSLIALFSKEAIQLFFDTRYYGAYQIVSIVSLSFAISACGSIFYLAIYQEKKTLFLMYVNIVGALVNIGFNFLLIPKFGVNGAAWATVITYLVVVLFSYYYAKKCYYASFNNFIVFFIFIVLLIINMVFYFSEITMLFSIVLKSLILIFVSVFIWYKYKNEILILLKK